MKIVLILIIVGLFILPLQRAEAKYGSSRAPNITNDRSAMAQTKNSNARYKVKDRQQATKMVKEKYRAKVVSVQHSKIDGKPAYKAKLLGNDGVVFYVYIDASSGQMRRR